MRHDYCGLGQFFFPIRVVFFQIPEIHTTKVGVSDGSPQGWYVCPGSVGAVKRGLASGRCESYDIDLETQKVAMKGIVQPEKVVKLARRLPIGKQNLQNLKQSLQKLWLLNRVFSI